MARITSHADDPREGTWPLLKTVVLLPFVPMIAIPRGARTDVPGLLLALAIHVLTMIVGALVLILLISLVDRAPYVAITQLPSELIDDISDFFRDLLLMDWQELALFVFAVASTIIGFEVSVVLAAVLTCGWTARPEPAIDSLKRSIVRWWLLTPHGMLVAMGTTTAAFTLITVALWYRRNIDYDWSAQPVWARNHEQIVMGMYILAGLWSTVVIIWTLVAGRFGGRCFWPAGCESCGYSLLGVDSTGTCPECGSPVAASVGPTARPGISWPIAAALSWIRPGFVGKRIHSLTHQYHHVVPMAITIIAIWILVPILMLTGMIYVGIIVGELENMLSDLDEILMIVLIGGSMIAANATGLVVATAMAGSTIVGSILTTICKRPMLHVTAYASGYTSLLAIPWLILLFLYIMASFTIIYLIDELNLGSQSTLMWWAVTAYIGFFVFLGAYALLQMIVQGRWAWQARRANW